MVLATVLLGCGRGVLGGGSGTLGGGTIDARADVAVADRHLGVVDVGADLPATIEVAPPPEVGGGDSSCGLQCGRVDTVYVEPDCTAVVPCPPTEDFTFLSVVAGDQLIPMSHLDGWEFLDDSRSAIILNGNTCQNLLAGTHTVTLLHGCRIP
jgi:hypothetical protein